MSWFPVDDAFHSHPKARRAGMEAIGLWTVSGSFCMAYLTDGFVPEWFVREKPRGLALAKRLVEAELWRVGRNGDEAGWWFHDWKPECTKEKVEEARAKARERKRKSREQAAPETPKVDRIMHRKTLRTGSFSANSYMENGESGGYSTSDQVNAESNHHNRPSSTDTSMSRVTGRVTDASRHADVLGQPNPTQPNPLLVVDKGGELTQVGEEPPVCRRHPNGTETPCGVCQRRRIWVQAADTAREGDELRKKRRARLAADNCPDCHGTNVIEVGDNAARKCNHPNVELANA